MSKMKGKNVLTLWISGEEGSDQAFSFRENFENLSSKEMLSVIGFLSSAVHSLQHLQVTRQHEMDNKQRVVN